MWQARCGPPCGSPNSALVSNFLLEVWSLPPQLVGKFTCRNLCAELCLNINAKYIFQHLAQAVGASWASFLTGLGDIRRVCGVKEEDHKICCFSLAKPFVIFSEKSQICSCDFEVVAILFVFVTWTSWLQLARGRWKYLLFSPTPKGTPEVAETPRSIFHTTDSSDVP